MLKFLAWPEGRAWQGQRRQAPKEPSGDLDSVWSLLVSCFRRLITGFCFSVEPQTLSHLLMLSPESENWICLAVVSEQWLSLLKLGSGHLVASSIGTSLQLVELS